jgi:hypothetical protein
MPQGVSDIIARGLHKFRELLDSLGRGIYPGDSVEENIDDFGIGIRDALVVPSGLASHPMCPCGYENRNHRNQH